jgi:dTDP-4-amino-4,6-dideoxygalactose transaminase
MIPFNKPYLSGKEMEYMRQAVLSGKISCNGEFTKGCESFFEKKYGFKRALLTTSCTHALEMAALLLGLKEGDEVILPSFAYVSDANAFALRGATLVFADSNPTNPNIDANNLEKLITPRTKAILVIHYAGVACEMDTIMSIAEKHKLFVIEDAAHSIDAFYKQKPLGGIGHLAVFSFHETKNIISGEGGMLVVNDDRFLEHAEVLREKGTNRQAFLRDQVNKYEWVDLGSSWMPSELTAAYLAGQLENLEQIQKKRMTTWLQYKELLSGLNAQGIQVCESPVWAAHNAHIFHLVCRTAEERDQLIAHLKQQDILAVFHYQPLHKSPYFLNTKSDVLSLPNAERYAECLVRLPLYFELEPQDVKHICTQVLDFYRGIEPAHVKKNSGA